MLHTTHTIQNNSRAITNTNLATNFPRTIFQLKDEVRKSSYYSTRSFVMQAKCDIDKQQKEHVHSDICCVKIPWKRIRRPWRLWKCRSTLCVGVREKGREDWMLTKLGAHQTGCSPNWALTKLGVHQTGCSPNWMLTMISLV